MYYSINIDQQMKYGKYEYERTFIVNKELLNQNIEEVKYLTDTYLIGTSLRLRKVVRKTETQYKLTQKKEDVPKRQGVKKITTIYLSNATYEMLRQLAGYEIEKTRHILVINQQRIGIDVVQVGTEQLYLAEVEFETEEEMMAYVLPIHYEKEVTNDPAYSGFEIASVYFHKRNDQTHEKSQ